MRKLSVITILCAILILFTACQGGISGDEAKSAVSEMARCLSEKRYEDAEALCHPDSDISAEILEAYISECEEKYGVDFTRGISIQGYTNISMAYYDSEVDGSFYAMTAKVKVGDQSLKMDVEMVKNDLGYGIRFLRFMEA